MSGILQEQHKANGSAYQCMKKEVDVLLRNRIEINGNMQETLLKKLMSFKFTRGIFTNLNNNADLNSDEANRYFCICVTFFYIANSHYYICI